MRLQVFLSHNGVCSRRDAMDLVKSGRVKVNGQIVREPSTPIEGNEHISVDGKPIHAQCYTYIMLNKPAGYTTTKDDPHAEHTVMDLLPAQLRHVSPVGRLDRESEGLLLLTNDGNLANQLMHPKYHAPKMYLVKVKGELTLAKKTKMEQGILLEGQKTAPCRIVDLKYNVGEGVSEFKITLNEGRKRQIRMMTRSVGHHVNFLRRLSIGALKLGDLTIGSWRELKPEEVTQLKKL